MFTPRVAALSPHTGKIPQPGVSIAGVDVVFDHVEHKVVGAGERPYRQRQQQGVGGWALPEQQQGGEAAEHAEQSGFQVQQGGGVGDVGLCGLRGDAVETLSVGLRFTGWAPNVPAIQA